jgi:hypothetical protein
VRVSISIAMRSIAERALPCARTVVSAANAVASAQREASNVKGAACRQIVIHAIVAAVPSPVVLVRFARQATVKAAVA